MWGYASPKFLLCGPNAHSLIQIDQLIKPICLRLSRPQPTLQDRCSACGHKQLREQEARPLCAGVVSRIASPLKPRSHLFHSYLAETGHSQSQALRVDQPSPGARRLVRERIPRMLDVTGRDIAEEQTAPSGSWRVPRFISVCTFPYVMMMC